MNIKGLESKAKEIEKKSKSERTISETIELTRLYNSMTDIHLKNAEKNMKWAFIFQCIALGAMVVALIVAIVRRLA